jgi:dienelactone hydrolase
MKRSPAFAALAAPAAALLLSGCIAGTMAGLPATDIRANAAAAPAPDNPEGNGAAADLAAGPAADTQLALAPAPAGEPAASQPPVCGALAAGQSAQGLVESRGKRFRMECRRADTAAPAPAVVILHGLHGIGRSTLYARLAEALNERGIHAFIFEYLTPEPPPGNPPVNPPAKPPAKAGAKTAVARPHGQTQAGGKTGAPAKPAPRSPGVESAAQARAISEAIAAVQALGYVDHRRVGMFGLSLGGFHALALAARDQRIAAVVNMFGAMPRAAAPEVTRMPPVLILHGDRDAVVPVRRAYELDRLLKRIGAEYEIKIYKGQGHSFRGAADADSLMRSVDFFARRLGPVRAASGPD